MVSWGGHRHDRVLKSRGKGSELYECATPGCGATKLVSVKGK
jgi:hypothetical protein